MSAQALCEADCPYTLFGQCMPVQTTRVCLKPADCTDGQAPSCCNYNGVQICVSAQTRMAFQLQCL
jgi:hypothetical protein